MTIGQFRLVPIDRIKQLNASVAWVDKAALLEDPEALREAAVRSLVDSAARELANKLWEHRKALVVHGEEHSGMVTLRMSVDVIVPEGPPE